jgi:hypothetical protein
MPTGRSSLQLKLNQKRSTIPGSLDQQQPALLLGYGPGHEITERANFWQSAALRKLGTVGISSRLPHVAGVGWAASNAAAELKRGYQEDHGFVAAVRTAGIGTS